MDWEIGLFGSLLLGWWMSRPRMNDSRTGGDPRAVPDSRSVIDPMSSPEPVIAAVSDLAVRHAQLQQECLQLRQQLTIQTTEAQIDSQIATFSTLQTLLTQYPSLRPMVAAQPDLPARNLIAMFTVLDNLLEDWGITPIGAPWEALIYDPQLHQGDAADLQLGESVYVRFVGYRQADRILVPAKVSRTLPVGTPTLVTASS
jgi:hypothetical protein